MSTIRSTLDRTPVTPVLRSVTYNNASSTIVLGLCSNRSTTLGTDSGGRLLASITDWTSRQVVFDLSAGGMRPTTFAETADGELLVSVYDSTAAAAGALWKSTGWNPTAMTVTTFTKVLDCSGPGAYVNLWGLHGGSVAPAGSPAAGTIVVNEYGTHTNVAATPDKGAVRVWLSRDHGATWTVIYRLDLAQPGINSMHMHGSCFDHYDNRIYITHGDGLTTNGGYSRVLYSDDLGGTWTIISQLNGSATIAFDQVTAIRAFRDCIIMLPDGPPWAIKRIQKRGRRNIGAPVNVHRFGGGSNVSFIGNAITQAPGGPIMCTMLTGSTAGYATIVGSYDGLEFSEIWREPSLPVSNLTGFQTAVGPTVTGNLLGFLTGDGRFGTGSIFVAPFGRTRRSQAGEPARTFLRQLTADQAVTNSAAIVDSGLKFTAEANAVYLVDIVLRYDGDATADLQATFSGPTGATFDWNSGGIPVATAAATAAAATDDLSHAMTDIVGMGCVGVGTIQQARLSGILITGSTAGDLVFRFAQQTAQASLATTVRARSALVANRIG